MRNHYSDPTANTAIANIMREEKRLKKLEEAASGQAQSNSQKNDKAKTNRNNWIKWPMAKPR